MSESVQCPSCEATIVPPGGRKQLPARCPWCGADLRPRPATPAAPPEHPEPVGEARPFLAVGILVACAGLAVGAYFLARHLTGPAG